ncbi:MAG: hypothetical protein KGI67_06760 [Pseudomonadota bacterium]|nr:hypothetical protein [Pseudomonadota bacterium]MDE3106459.1 hypothetical protein [Acidobacteriota bacterium]
MFPPRTLKCSWAIIPTHWPALIFLLMLLSACATLPKVAPEQAHRSFAFDTPQQTTLGRQAAELANGREGRSGFRLTLQTAVYACACWSNTIWNRHATNGSV